MKNQFLPEVKTRIYDKIIRQPPGVPHPIVGSSKTCSLAGLSIELSQTDLGTVIAITHPSRGVLRYFLAGIRFASLKLHEAIVTIELSTLWPVDRSWHLDLGPLARDDSDVIHRWDQDGTAPIVCFPE